MHKLKFNQEKSYESIIKGLSAQSKEIDAKLKKLVLNKIEIKKTREKFLMKIKQIGDD